MLRNLSVLTLMCFVVLKGNAQAVDSYGPIRSGEMLWNIATKVRPDASVSQHQVMVTLFKANPQAFQVSCNMNSLRVGQRLRIPSVTEMQALSTAAAVVEFNRQSSEWRAYQRGGQAIDCPSVESVSAALVPATADTAAIAVAPAAAEIRKDIASVTHAVEHKLPPTVVNHVDNQTKASELSVITSAQEAMALWFAEVHVTVMMGIVIGGGLLLLAFLGGWWLHRMTRASVAQDRAMLNTHERRQRVRSEQPVLPELSIEESGEATVAEEIKEKLAYVRTYLAEGEEKAVQSILKEVMEKGTPEQQEEARQLVEINRKMSTLELHLAKNQSIAIPDASTAWQELMKMGKRLPSRYYLEDQEKVFKLVDRIFELLDQELNAQGKLVEAYADRCKRDSFNVQAYQILKKQEKVIVEEDLESTLKLFRGVPKPTRRL